MDISNLLAHCSFGESWLRDYSLMEFINAGSYGGVYKAEHKTTKHKSAVKITYLQKHLLDGGTSTENVEACRDKMNREFLLLIGKKHPNIVNVYDGLETKLNQEHIEEILKNVTNAGNIDGKHVRNNFEYWAAKTGLDALFIRMELCDLTLREWIDNSECQGTTLWIQQITIINNILSGLQFLHENKILHRDLKSENILLEGFSYSAHRAKIGDFGLGRIIHSDESKTSTLTMKPMTTPLYKAPELESGNEYTLQADLYSLGLIIYEIVKMLKSSDRRVEFSKIRTERIIDELPKEPFVNVSSVILQLTESDTTNRLETVRKVQLDRLDEVILQKETYSSREFRDITDIYKRIIGNPEGGHVVTEGITLRCDNGLITNVVFGSGVYCTGNNNKLYNVTFAPDMGGFVWLGVTGNGNVIQDIKIESQEARVVLLDDKIKVSNVLASGNENYIFRIFVESGVGHRIKNISMCCCEIVFDDLTSSCTIENVKSVAGSSLDGQNHILTNVDCDNLKVEGKGHKFVDCRGSVKISPDSNYEFINCSLNFENL